MTTVETIAKPIAEFPRDRMGNRRYSLRVMPYLFGQFRLQLLDHERLEPDTGQPSIAQELCTYKRDIYTMVSSAIIMAVDPLAYCLTLANKYNCDGPGGRIRLDVDSTTNPYPRQRDA